MQVNLVFIRVNGINAVDREMELVFSSGQMVLSMKVSGLMTKLKEKAE